MLLAFRDYIRASTDPETQTTPVVFSFHHNHRFMSMKFQIWRGRSFDQKSFLCKNKPLKVLEG